MHFPLKTELYRKLIHILGLLFIPLLYYSRELTLMLCISLIPLYLIEEYLFRKELELGGLITFFQKCKRPHEADIFILDPIFMVVGVFIAVFFYPLTAAACAIFQVSLADAGAAIVGIQWGHRKLPWSSQKTWEGTFVFFAIAFLGSLLFFDWQTALILAGTGTVLEQIPIKGIDNLTIPVGVGVVAMLLM